MMRREKEESVLVLCYVHVFILHRESTFSCFPFTEGVFLPSQRESGATVLFRLTKGAAICMYFFSFPSGGAIVSPSQKEGALSLLFSYFTEGAQFAYFYLIPRGGCHPVVFLLYRGGEVCGVFLIPRGECSFLIFLSCVSLSLFCLIVLTSLRF